MSSTSGQPKAPVIFITSANGCTGAAVANSIAALGTDKFSKLVLGCSDKECAHEHVDLRRLENKVEFREHKWSQQNKPQGMTEGLQGVDTIVIIPPTRPNKYESTRAIIAEAEKAGVQNAVFLSWTGTHAAQSEGMSTGGALQCTQLVQHQSLENDFKACKIPNKVVVRANFFLQNFLTYAKQIVKDGKLPVPLSDGRKIAPLDLQVLGQAMARIAIQPTVSSRIQGQTITLTGPVAVDAKEVADNLSKALGRLVVPEKIALSEASKLLQQAKPGMDVTEIESLLETYALIEHGRMDQTSSDLQEILGIHHPTLLESFQREAPVLKQLASA